MKSLSPPGTINQRKEISRTRLPSTYVNQNTNRQEPVGSTNDCGVSLTFSSGHIVDEPQPQVRLSYTQEAHAWPREEHARASPCGKRREQAPALHGRRRFSLGR